MHFLKHSVDDGVYSLQSVLNFFMHYKYKQSLIVNQNINVTKYESTPERKIKTKNRWYPVTNEGSMTFSTSFDIAANIKMIGLLNSGTKK